MKMVESSQKRIENTVGKGEIARYEQFLLSNSVFKGLVLQSRKNKGLFWKSLMHLYLQDIARLFNFCYVRTTDIARILDP